MLTVKASAQPSPVNGIGLFADEPIAKGTTTWKFDSRWDITFPPEEVAAMPEQQRAYIERYGYLSKTMNVYVVPLDDSRFTNHSSTKANMDSVAFPGETETRGVANRDIAIGEELLVNYRVFDVVDETSTDPYLDT